MEYSNNLYYASLKLSNKLYKFLSQLVTSCKYYSLVTEEKFEEKKYLQVTTMQTIGPRIVSKMYFMLYPYS